MAVLLEGIEQFIRLKFNINNELNGKSTENGDPPQVDVESFKADIEHQQEEEEEQQKHQQLEQQLEKHKDILQITSESLDEPEPSFTLIGSTQHDTDKENKENQSVSQFFSRVKDYRGNIAEGKTPVDSDRKSYRSRSPVLRPEMFENPPDLPGIDAVYINRFEKRSSPILLLYINQGWGSGFGQKPDSARCTLTKVDF